MYPAFSTHVFLDQPFDEKLIAQIKNYGFDAVEIWGMRPHFDYRNIERVKELAAFIKSEGIKISSVHAPFYNSVGEARAGKWLSITDSDPQIRAAAVEEILAASKILPLFDYPALVVHPGGIHDEDSEGFRNLLKESLEKILSEIDKGAKIALENITSKLGTLNNVLDVIKYFDSPNLGLCLDIGHANMEPEGVLSSIDKAAPYLIHIHASDNDSQKDAHLLPLEGTIDWHNVVKKLQIKAYRGAFVWELRSTEQSEILLTKIYASSGKIFPKG